MAVVVALVVIMVVAIAVGATRAAEAETTVVVAKVAAIMEVVAREVAQKSKNLSLWSCLVMSSSLYATDITLRVSDCLRSKYALDQQSVDAVLQKLKPLVESDKHHVLLEQFIELSATMLQGNATEQHALPTDDAVVAAPKDHEILSENDKVRVLWGVSFPGETVPLHRHYWKSILIMLQDGRFETEYADGSKEASDDPLGVYELPPDVQAAAYKNIGARCSFLRFEIK